MMLPALQSTTYMPDEKRPRGRPKREPRTELEKWIKENFNNDYKALAEALGLKSDRTIRVAAKGYEPVSRSTALLIELYTKGAVPASTIKQKEDDKSDT